MVARKREKEKKRKRERKKDKKKMKEKEIQEQKKALKETKRTAPFAVLSTIVVVVDGKSGQQRGNEKRGKEKREARKDEAQMPNEEGLCFLREKREQERERDGKEEERMSPFFLFSAKN